MRGPLDDDLVVILASATHLALLFKLANEHTGPYTPCRTGPSGDARNGRVNIQSYGRTPEPRSSLARSAHCCGTRAHGSYSGGMASRNRVTPTGEIEAFALRGAWTGNRGILHVGREIGRASCRERV